MEKSIKLAIKLNNCATNDPCAICGDRTDPEIGPELFLADTWDVVCHACGMQHEIELVHIIEMVRLARKVYQAERA